MNGGVGVFRILNHAAETKALMIKRKEARYTPRQPGINHKFAKSGILWSGVA
jgi:hypothetical protein